MRMSPNLTLPSFALLLAVLAGCSSFSELPDVTSMLSPYRIDVRQGNYITQDMVVKLKAGQSKDQVRFILGSPLIEEAFHRERWDYIYRLKPGHGEVIERTFAVYFVDDKLARVSGDVIAETPEAAAADQKNAADKTKVIDISGVPAPKEASSSWWSWW